MSSLRQLPSFLVAFFLPALAGCPAMPDPALDDAGLADDVQTIADADGDGVPDGEDCDPASAAVGRTSSRACDGACGAGTEECSDGIWGACTPDVECRCETEGERRIAVCGNCGEVSEECMGGMWTAVSMCLNEGCMPGAVETRTGAFCLEEQRLCDAACEWGAWSETHPTGECTPGTRMGCLPPTGDRLCNDDCIWGDDPCCPGMDPPLPECS